MNDASEWVTANGECPPDAGGSDTPVTCKGCGVVFKSADDHELHTQTPGCDAGPCEHGYPGPDAGGSDTPEGPVDYWEWAREMGCDCPDGVHEGSPRHRVGCAEGVEVEW